MKQQKDSRSFVLWLSLTVLGLSVGLAVMAALSLRQSASVEAAARLQSDSITALTFQTEREFLRFRNELRVALHTREAADWDAVAARFDIFASRIYLMRDNPSTAKLAQRSEYNTMLPRLQALVEEIDPLLQAPQRHRAALEAHLADMTDMGPDMQGLSFAANSVVSMLVDRQVEVVRDQNRMITWLVAVQALVLVAATAGLVNRNRRLQREREALEALNIELSDARDAAEAANRAKGQFLANMSHELRTPFNGMLGMISMLEDSDLNDSQRDQLQTARGSAQHLLTLLNDILDMSALDAGKMKVRPEPVDLPQLVSETVELMQGQAQRKGLQMTLELAEVKAHWVEIDPTRIRQILLNLISNAIKFTAQGQVVVRLDSDALPGAVRWRVLVRDTGMGMDASTLSQLFQRFHQADDSATRRFGGTGLGLEISRSLARLMNGDISAESEHGVGSSFTLTITTPTCEAPEGNTATIASAVLSPMVPATMAPLSSDTEPPAKPMTATAAPAETVAGASATNPDAAWQVLVAEDHPVNRKFVGLILEKLGHHATFAENGLEAWQAASEGDYDIVLMDLHMPEMDGLEAAQRIRALPGRRGQVPIVALTADVMNEARDRARDAGMNAYLSKPVQKQQLQEVMAHCVATGWAHTHQPQ